MGPRIAVVGSINADLVVQMPKLPGRGETVSSAEPAWFPGGKGANQAVMAGLLGAETFMITCLGDDVYADMTVDNYIKCGVNVEHIQKVDGSSGVAPIWVDQSGQNRIIVIPGANNEIDAKKASTVISTKYKEAQAVVKKLDFSISPKYVQSLEKQFKSGKISAEELKKSITTLKINFFIQKYIINKKNTILFQGLYFFI